MLIEDFLARDAVGDAGAEAGAPQAAGGPSRPASGSLADVSATASISTAAPVTSLSSSSAFGFWPSAQSSTRASRPRGA